MIAEQWGVGQVLWSMVWFFLFFIWIWLLVVVFSDIFRSHDMGGFAKTLWVLFVIVFPYLGVFIYLIARGHKMAEHAQQAAQKQDQAMRAYVQSATDAGGSGVAGELEKLADLKGRGVISQAEFDAQKAKLLA